MSDRIGSPLVVVALGGNAVSPARGDGSFDAEREAIGRAADELAILERRRLRLLVVHGNGPQVGRLLATPDLGALESLDIHVAQTQGELGYLLTKAMDDRLERPSVALFTRVIVDADDPALAHPTKPVGPVLDDEPVGLPSVRMPDGTGWRRVVASPRPTRVAEESAIATLLQSSHVVAGGGGGVALSRARTSTEPCSAVVDKDWVASSLAVSMDADLLVFVTDVTHAFDGFGGLGQSSIGSMSPREARRRLEGGAFAPGSMAPKVESAVEYVEATGRPAVIAALGEVEAAIAGRSGTRIEIASKGA